MVSGERRDLFARMITPVLSLASVPYGFAVRARNRRYDSGQNEVHRVDVPVICVGNLTVGGTGKTPMVAFLCRWFRKRNIRVAIVSRGYGAEAGKQNDEARELAECLPDVPHIQNPDRVAAARVAAEELEMQVVILDDGFQHRRLARDLDLVLVDASNPFGHDALLPRGLLREPVTSLQRADVIGLTRANLVSKEARSRIRNRVEQEAPRAGWLELIHQPTELVAGMIREDLANLEGRRTMAFCGLGNPEGFRKTLLECGTDLVHFQTFPDHHEYSREDLEGIEREARQREVSMLVCTHKDWVKIGLDQLGGIPVRALLVEQHIETGFDSLNGRLESVLQRIR